MKKCYECDKWEQSTPEKGDCRERFGNMETECLLRHIYGLLWDGQHGSKEIKKKLERIMDKTEEDMGKGDEWRG